MNSNPTITPTLHHTIQNQNFDQLQKIIALGSAQMKATSTETVLRNILQLGITYIAKQQLSNFSQIAKQFSAHLSEHRHIFLHHEFLIQNFSELKLMVCKHNKLFTLGKPGVDLKGYVLVGKAASVHKRKKKQQQDVQNKQQRQQLSNLIEQGIIRLFEDGKYILPKYQKHFQLTDILLHHDMPDSSIDEVYLGNQVYSPFVPIQKTIVLVIPSKNFKPQCLSFIKSSLLHSYVDQANLLNRIIVKQLFYKNSILKGIFFVDEGEVQVKSGRVIARGWTTFGKCKTSGFGWKFKPVPFVRFLLKNISIWKQFFNDIKLNDEYPFNIINILSLNEDEDFTSSAEWKSLGKKKMGVRSPKLPKLNGTRSIDESKLEQIQKMRHYDDRISGIFSYKQDLLTRKLKGIVHGKFQPIFKDQRSQQKMEKKKKLIMLRFNSKASVMEKRQLPMQTQPAENILIMSVLKRLQSIADMNETRRRDYSVTHGINEKQEISLNLKSKRQNLKALPMQIHERTKQLHRSKRY